MYYHYFSDIQHRWQVLLSGSKEMLYRKKDKKMNSITVFIYPFTNGMV